MKLGRTAAVTAVLVTAVAACSSGPVADSNVGDVLKGAEIEVLGPWSGDEQARFGKVLEHFAEKTGAVVKYTAAGDELPTVLQTRIAGGAAPSIAMVAQPGLVQQLATKKELKPVAASVSTSVEENFAGVWKQLATFDGQLYGVYFKGANKSTVWYNNAAFEKAGVRPPQTWEQFIELGHTLSDAGQGALSIGGADGWTLTDWFENVYLRTAGPENYDKLAKHEILWTDPTVKTALRELAKVFGDPRLVVGGSSEALQTEFAKSVTNVFSDDQKAAMVYEGDFVSGVITSSTPAKVGFDAKFFPFPSVSGSKTAVVAGGDMAVQFKDDAATTAFMEYLASVESGARWATQGGFLSPNKNIPGESYPDDVTRDLAKQLVDAGDNVRFDMSDLAPAAFGGTKGAGEWKLLQDFLANPSTVDVTADRLESEAAKAFAK